MLSKRINCGSSSYIFLNTMPGTVWTQLTTQSVSSSCAGLCFTQLTQDGGKTKLTMRRSVTIELLLYASHWCSAWVGGCVRACRDVSGKNPIESNMKMTSLSHTHIYHTCTHTHTHITHTMHTHTTCIHMHTPHTHTHTHHAHTHFRVTECGSLPFPFSWCPSTPSLC